MEITLVTTSLILAFLSLLVAISIVLRAEDMLDLVYKFFLVATALFTVRVVADLLYLQGAVFDLGIFRLIDLGIILFILLGFIEMRRLIGRRKK